MPITLNGTTGITTPGLINTGSTTFVDLTTTGNTILGDASTDTLNVANGNLVLNSSGNAGLGVTPSAWVAPIKALQINTTGALWANSSTIFLTNNTFTDGTDKYLTTAAATRYYQSAGSHIWDTAASGTAGNAVTFTQTMTLDASGNLLVGATSSNGKLTIKNPNVSGEQQILKIQNAASTGDLGGFTFNQTDDMFKMSVISSVGYLSFGTGSSATERARIDSSGRFGLGMTPSGSYSLQIYGIGSAGSGSARIRLNNSSTGTADADGGGIAMEGVDLVIQNSENGVCKWEINGSERARITSAGDVGIGNSAPPMRLGLSVAGAVISGTATIGTNMQGIQVYNTTTATTNNAVGIWFPTGPHQAGIASFRPNAEAGWATVLAFYTHGAATSGLTDCYERMRIDGEGRVQIGTTSAAYSATLTLLSAANSYNLTSSRIGAGTGSLGHVVFETDSGAVGTIFTTD